MQHFILASKSPRRHELLKALGYTFEVVDLDADESFPETTPVEEIAALISRKKALAYTKNLHVPVITADTIVVLGREVLGKPKDREEAFLMLRKLSDNTHQVYTAVTIRSKEKTYTFTERTDVTFRSVTEEEIAYYVDTLEPYDKAGSYGVQDWWGMAVVRSLNGSYTNVMGLPTEKLYEVLSAQF